jgi:hypothetical protein
LLRWASAPCLLLITLLGAGCNNNPPAGVQARPAVTPMSDDEAELQARIDRVRDDNARRYMNTREHAAWQLVHGILAYQDQLKIRSAPDSKEPPFPALKYLLEGGDVRGFTLQPRQAEIVFKPSGQDRYTTRGLSTDRSPGADERLVGQWVLAEIADPPPSDLEALRQKQRETDERNGRRAPAYLPREALSQATRAGKITVIRDAETLATIVEGGSKSGQGHPNQWLGYLLVDYPPPPGRQPAATWDTPVVYEEGNASRRFTVADMLKEAKLSMRQGQESAWSLIALTAFPELVPLDEPWDVTHFETADGKPVTEKWSIERILEMEYAYGYDDGFHTSSCGGTHRLIGLSLAVQRYRKYRRDKGLPEALTGGWSNADEMVRWGIDRIRQFQQEDGAFSAQWLQRPGMTSDVAVRIRTTGHCLEFLALTLPPEKLAEDWVTRAVVHLCELFEQTKELPLDCGATYHALHGLQVYREKRWGVPR